MWCSQRVTGALYWPLHTLALSANCMPGSGSGAGEIVNKTGVPRPGLEAEERKGNEKNDDDLEHSSVLTGRVIRDIGGAWSCLGREL